MELIGQGQRLQPPPGSLSSVSLLENRSSLPLRAKKDPK